MTPLEIVGTIFIVIGCVFALTGSVGVVTINLPRIGFEQRDEESFFERLDGLMDLARDSLEVKRKLLERLTDAGLYPYARHYLQAMRERTGSFWHNHFSTVGVVGLNEAVQNLLGCGLADHRGRQFGLQVLEHMRERLSQYQEETGRFYNLEATPAEGTSYRLALKDKARDPRICCANEDAWIGGAQPYYSNSSHMPVGFSDDPFEVLDHQDAFQTSYTGGTVLHGFVGEAIEDPRSVRTFVRTVCEQYSLPYFTVTPTFSICPEHGYQAGEHQECPHCQAACEVYSRVVGYLRPVQQWNGGKQAEFADRQTYQVRVGSTQEG